MTWPRRTRPYVTPSDTPVMDRLMTITGGEPLATFNGQPGGEWDSLRGTRLRVRQRLTGAGLMARDGMHPDVFADLLRLYGGTEVGPDPIEWYVREGLRALDERQRAALADRRRRVARATGHPTYYAHRDAWCRERGFPSLWHYRRHHWPEDDT